MFAIRQYPQTCPFDKLPAELVAEIFFHAVGISGSKSHDAQDWPAFLFPIERPFILSAVSRRWREIATTTPRLWSTVFLKFRKPSHNGNELQLLQQWLSRTGTVPLSLVIDWSLFHSSHQDNEDEVAGTDFIMSEMTDTIVSLLPRCNYINIAMGTSGRTIDLTKISDAFAAGLPLLEELLLRGSHSVLDLSACSRLTAVTSSLPFSQLNLSEQQLSSFRSLITSGTPAELFQIFNSCQVMNRLSFGIEWSSFEQLKLDHTDEPIVLPRLRNFRVFRPGSLSLWDHITLPSLKVLQISSSSRGGEGAGPNWPSLFSFLVRSRPPLEYLELQTSKYIRESELITLLALIPTLKTLNLTLSGVMGGVSSDFWRALRGEYAVPAAEMKIVDSMVGLDNMHLTPLCPRLENIELSTYERNGSTETAKTILARSGPTGTLRRVSLWNSVFTLHEFLAYPEVLDRVQGGLDLCVLGRRHDVTRDGLPMA